MEDWMRPFRLMLAALAVCLVSTPALAGIEVGPITGFSFSNLRIDGEDNLQGRSSFAIGAAADYGLNDRMGIRVEPTFLSKGTKATNRNAYWGTLDGVVYDLAYLDVPVLLRYDLATTPTRGYLLGGFAVSFATKREADLTQGNNSETVDMSGVLSSTDVSFNFGVGMSVAAGANRLTFDARTAIGLVDINNGGTVTFAGAPLAVPGTATNTLDFRILATLLFPVGGQ
jgi:hypothetical protein